MFLINSSTDIFSKYLYFEGCSVILSIFYIFCEKIRASEKSDALIL